MYKQRETCRVCGSDSLTPILSLGKQYVTNFIESPKEEASKGPLDLVLCNVKKGGCGLLQLKHTFNRDHLYKKYWFRSGTSLTIVNALRSIVECSEKLIHLNSEDLVLDIGSNDGTLLKQYKTKDLIRVGFEPSNLWYLSLGEEINTINDYFSINTFKKKFAEKKAKIITSIAMFYDLDDPNLFVRDVKSCLDKEGLWIVQMNYLGLMLENNTFDNICHEHLEYYSLLSLENLLKKHNLEAFDVETNDINGGSFRIYIKHKNGNVKKFDGSEQRLQSMRAYEEKLHLNDEKVYLEFAERISKIKEEIMTFLTQEVKNGKQIYIFGASTRGLVVLQYAGIDNKLISAATDKNPDKIGRYIVGTGIPIISLEDYRQKKPDYLFVMPYHLISEIALQEKEFLECGGKMIVAIPNFKIIDKNYLRTLENN